jgi:predicted GIY-YIG superfamily endonuclease
MNGTRLRIDHYDFGPAVFDQLRDNSFARDLWPVVYILSNGDTREAYIGETTDTFARMAAHARHDAKSRLTSVRLITSETFHKSATLDIESNLIRYVAADGQFSLLNGNLGIAYHNYYQKNEVYWQLFRDIWERLRSEGLAKHSLEHIDNSDLFKYSPYKCLSREQADSLVAMLHALAGENTSHVVVEGGAGTGKTILAIFLCKLLSGRLDDMSFRDFGDREQEILQLLETITAGRPRLKLALVVPMASFRTTLKKVFKNIKGLSASMVVGPSDIVKERFDLIVVDESHRLRRRVNLGTYFGAFDKACATLGLDPATASELDWVSMQSDKTLLFYPVNQALRCPCR